MTYYSPLRYPGGKARLAGLVKTIFRANGLIGGSYAEPYAGGAGLALALLFEEYASDIYLNDVDPAVHAIWSSILEKTEDFCRLVRDTPVTSAQWHHQRDIYAKGDMQSRLALGFASFFLNRTNRSGIIDSGSMIGGLQQDGEWKLDARYNRTELTSRIKRIARYRDRIHLSNLDAVDFLAQAARTLARKSLVYLDPPYYTKGRHLYASYYEADDHLQIARLLSSLSFNWVISYDDAAAVRRLYRGYRSRTYTLQYTAAERREGTEVMFFSPNLVLPHKIRSTKDDVHLPQAVGLGQR